MYTVHPYHGSSIVVSYTFIVCGEMFGEKVSVIQPRSQAPMLRNVNTEVGSISITCTFTVYGEAFVRKV